MNISTEYFEGLVQYLEEEYPKGKCYNGQRMPKHTEHLIKLAIHMYKPEEKDKLSE